MAQLIAEISRPQAEAVRDALTTFARLCRRDVTVLLELLASGFIPAYGAQSKGQPADAAATAEAEWIVRALGSVLGAPVEEVEHLAHAGMQATGALAELMKQLQRRENDRIVLACAIECGTSVADALDVFTRLGIGQVRVIDDLVMDGTIPVRNADGSARLARPAETERCAALIERLQRSLGYRLGQSLGVGNRGVHVSAHRAWEVCKALRQALAMHRDPSPAFRGVHYDGLLVRYTDDPAPSIRIVQHA